MASNSPELNAAKTEVLIIAPDASTKYQSWKLKNISKLKSILLHSELEMVIHAFVSGLL